MLDWIPWGMGYLSGSLDNGYYKETWKTGETRTLTPVSGSTVINDQKKCFNKDGSETTCSTNFIHGW